MINGISPSKNYDGKALNGDSAAQQVLDEETERVDYKQNKIEQGLPQNVYDQKGGLLMESDERVVRRIQTE